MLRSRLLIGLALFGAAVALLAPSNTARAEDRKAAVVDVVLCLDVSGSMNHLIDSAKGKLWDIVNDLGKVKPAPRLRVGLYSYGHTFYDPKKGWVRKDADLTEDLDSVYQKLNSLNINGGEEYVARVCRDAIVEQKWSEDRKALKMIFVCGNEPVDQDKQVHLKDVAQMALKKDIIINTIYCERGRQFLPEAKGWEDFARMAEGRYAPINMRRGTVAIAAPQDKKLQELSSKLNTTYVAYGTAEHRQFKAQNQAAQDANAARAPGAGAGRAATKGGALYRNSDWDIIDRMKDDPKFDITKIPEAELCDELRKLKPEERMAYIQKKKTEREAIQKEIVELSAQRAKYISEEMKKKATAGEKALDDAIRGTLREQANKKGIQIPD
jgi:hypothetical protein